MADYKEKLKDFITDIPAFPGQVVSGNACKPPYTPEFKAKLADKNPAVAAELAGAWSTTDKFKKLTGVEHLTLIKNWAGGGIMTTCNEFVGKASLEMGSPFYLGVFELEELLRSKGKAHAWVPANSGKRPGYGDVFRPTKFHMGISLGFEGEDWLTVESGQGGSTSGYDIIKRKKQKFDPALLLGWCNTRILLDPRPGVPDWLVGVWVIYCGDKTYHYSINEYYEASFYPWAPIGGTQNATPTDTGKVTFQDSDSFSITWSQEGGTEKFKYDRFESFPGLMEKMSGTSAAGEPLKGVRT
jgi:hypothetical protein